MALLFSEYKGKTSRTHYQQAPTLHHAQSGSSADCLGSYLRRWILNHRLTVLSSGSSSIHDIMRLLFGVWWLRIRQPTRPCRLASIETLCKLPRVHQNQGPHTRSFQQNQRNSLFLHLPSEIRNKIYFIVASGPLEIVRTKNVSHDCAEPNLCPQAHYRLIKSNAGLAVTCRQIRHDMWKVCALELPSVLILPKLPLPLRTIFEITGFTQCTQLETLRLNMSATTFQNFIDRTDLAPEAMFGRHWWRGSETLWGLKRMVFLETDSSVPDLGYIRDHINMPDLTIEFA